MENVLKFVVLVLFVCVALLAIAVVVEVFQKIFLITIDGCSINSLENWRVTTTNV